MGKKIPVWQALLAMIFLVIALMYGLGMGRFLDSALGTKNVFACPYEQAHLPLVIAAIFAGIIAILNGYKWSYLESGILASINRSMQACLILLIIGMLISTWIAAGVVPSMIYYGLMIISPNIFLFAGCLLCSIVALATGSSWTTAGTIGIALIGIGQGLGISPAMTGGAIVSGAYFGDKMSPLSDTTNLAPAMAGATLFDHIRHMVYTVTPSLIIALVIFAVLGLNVKQGDTKEAVDAIQSGLKDSFTISPILLVPPLVVILIVAFRLPAIPGLFGGVFIAIILGGLIQGVPFEQWFGLMHDGFTFETSKPFDALNESIFVQHPEIAKDYEVSTLLDLKANDFAEVAKTYNIGLQEQTQYNLYQLLTRGGMSSMLWTINLIICAMCFGGVMDASGMLGTLAEALLKLVHGTGSLIIVTVVSCILVNILAGDQYLAIILPGRMYKETFEDNRLKAKNLSRCLEDAGTITSGLVPWNTCGATMQKFLGVKTWGGPGGGYGRYAFLNLINPLVSIIYGITGFSMEKMTEEEYQTILEAREKEKNEALKSLEA